MKWVASLTNKLNLLIGSISFFKDHFLTIFGLGLFAAFGRVIQLGGFGEVPGGANIILEVIVETSRILIFLFVLGVANIKTGAYQVRRLFAGDGNLKSCLSIALGKLRTQWVRLSLSVCGFLVIVVAINFLIDTLAYETCLFLTLKKQGILVEWTILLFFKNILVIPFTIVFDGILLLWVTNKLRSNSIIGR
jgi:hypothetical protein